MKESESIYSIVEIPKWVNDPKKPEVTSLRPDSPYFFPTIDYQIYVEDNKISTFTSTYECINDESRIEDSSLCLHELHKDYEYLFIHSISIIRNGKVINALSQENISTIQRERSLESHIVDNRLTVSVSIDDLRVGDHIEYKSTRVETSGDHPLMGKYLLSHHRNSWGCPVDSQFITIKNESKTSISCLKSKRVDGLEKITKDEIIPNESTKFEWHDLPITRVPNSTPDWVWADYTEFATKTSWNKVSEYLYRFFIEKGAFVEPEFDYDDEPMNLILSKDNKESQIIEAIRFVQNKIRYRGENHGVFTHTPKPAQIILKKRAGDCKDKSNLLLQLLSKLGIKAYLVLVHTKHGEKIDSFLPSPYQFNHMIVGFEWQDVTYFVDPTIQKQSGTLESMAKLEFGWGLPLVKEGGNLVYIERDMKRLVFSLLHEIDFPKDSQNHKLKITRTYFNHRADNMRAYFNSIEKDSYQLDFFNTIKEDTKLNMEVIQPIIISKDDEFNNSLETIEEYKIININKTHDKSTFSLLTSFINDLPISEHKTFPVVIDIEGKLEHKIIVNYDRAPDLEETQTSVNGNGFKYIDVVSKLDKKTIVYYSEITPKEKWLEGGDKTIDHYDKVIKVHERSYNLIQHKNGNIVNFDISNVFVWLFIIIGIIGLLRDKL